MTVAVAGAPARVSYGFAIGGLGAEALNQSRNAWLLYFYAPPDDADRAALLPLALVTALLFAGKLLEAFDDALIGYASDRTRSRWGRRMPWIAAAAPFWALFGVLTFIPPGNGTAVTALWFFIVLQCFHLAATCTEQPYEALFPTLARGPRERVSLSALRVYFGLAGAAVGLVGSSLLVELVGFGGMALFLALVALATRYIGLAGMWQRARLDNLPVRAPLRPTLRAAWTNRHYVVFLPSFVLFQVGVVMMIGALPYYAGAILRTDSEGFWVAALTGVAMLGMAATIPVAARLARRWTMRVTYERAMLAAVLMFPLLALPGLRTAVPVELQVLGVMCLAGAALAGVYLFPGPLLADICDADAAVSGQRREGVFYGGFSFAIKSVGAIAPLVLGLVLLLGDDAADPLGVRLVGPVAALSVAVAWLLFRRFTLDEPATFATPTEGMPSAGAVPGDGL
jgi:GPH family glycoside/pentoside/hexuronide:cation symporter